MEGVQTESIHDCFYTAVKLYYQKTRGGQYNSSCVQEKKTLICLISLLKILKYSEGKNPFLADIYYLTHAFAANASTV